MDYAIKFFIVMIAMALTDVCWTYYFIKVNERHSIQAGTWAVLLFFAGAVVTTNYIHDSSLMVAAAIGSFAGTTLTIEYKKRKESSKIKNKKTN